MRKLVLLIFIFSLMSCGESVDKSSDTKPVVDESIYDEKGQLKTDVSLINQGKFTQEKLIANIGLGLVIPTTAQFAKDTRALKEANEQFCENLANSSEISKEQVEFLKLGVQSAWKNAMGTYHKLELLNFGPVAEETSNFYDAVYTFSDASKCVIDRRVQTYASRGRLPDLNLTDNYTERGLDALEPLLFDDMNKSRCRRVNSRLQAWFDKNIQERQLDVCGYTKHLIADIDLKAKELAKRWSLTGENYLVDILRNEKLGTKLQAINKISRSLFELDSLRKIKLAYPAGFKTKIGNQVKQCSQDSCPEKAEHLFAKMSVESLLFNLETFKDLFMGKEGFGFDDFLKQEGYEDLANDFESAINNIIAKFKGMQGKTTIAELTAGISRDECEASTTINRKVEACALMADIKVITDLLKNEYLLALKDLSAPRETQGDTD